MAKRQLLNPLSLMVVALAAAALYFVWLAEQGPSDQSRPQQAVPVRVQTLQVSEFRDVIEALGTARANESIVVTAQVQDIVTAVHFNDGDVVEAGQLLVEMEAREQTARVQELKFRLAEANRQYQRLLDLNRQNVASQQQLESQEVVVKEITAALEVAESQLAQKRVVAPFAGRLGVRQVSQGSLLSPGAEITTLDDIATIKLDFNVPEIFFASLQIGQQVSARSDAYPGEEFIGVIRTIDSRVDPMTRAILVRAELPNELLKLRPGMLLRVHLLRSVDQTLVLPERAIVPVQDRHYVYVVSADNTVKQTQVSIGRRRPGIVEIVGGVEPGERIVTEGIVRLRDGVSVSIQEN